MTNPNSISLQDYMLAYFKAAYNGTTNEPGSVTVGSGIKTTSSGGSSNAVITGPVDGNGNVKVSQQGSVDNARTGNRYASINNSGTATAPAANAAIATVAVFDAYYEVDVIVGFGATAETTAIDNFQLKHGTTVVATLPVANVANSQSQTYRLYVNPGGTDTDLTVRAVAAGSAGSVYKATIIITRQI